MRTTSWQGCLLFPLCSLIFFISNTGSALQESVVDEVGWHNVTTKISNSNLEGHQREEETDGTKIQQQQLGTFIAIVVGEAKNINGISRL